jgi:hypothetical protein
MSQFRRSKKFLADFEAGCTGQLVVQQNQIWLHFTSQGDSVLGGRGEDYGVTRATESAVRQPPNRATVVND